MLLNDFLKHYDLTTTQFDVLVQIATYDQLTQSELAEKATVTQGGISRMLARLEKDQLIERKQELKTKTIQLTEKVKRKLESAFEAQLAFQTSFFDDCLTKDEQKTLLSLIHDYKNIVKRNIYRSNFINHLFNHVGYYLR